jgi:hypothetical protein
LWIAAPQIIYVIGSAIACADVIGHFLVVADTTQMCLGKTHVFYILTLMIPIVLLITIGGLIGFIMLRKKQ